MTLTILSSFALQTGVDPNQFNNYLFLGYAVMWLIGLIYVASLAMRQRNLRRDLDLMEDILQDGDQEAS
ncbi:MAG: CcmD family protein [Candidatus Promineifilaceae bacterium]